MYTLEAALGAVQKMSPLFGLYDGMLNSREVQIHCHNKQVVFLPKNKAERAHLFFYKMILLRSYAAHVFHTA